MLSTLRCLLLAPLAVVAGGWADASPVSFRNDVMPHLLSAGCAAGNCHAKPEGQNNLKLSVFGFDPQHDFHEIVRDNRGRRLSFAAPEESLLLKKATGQISHEGGVRFKKDSEAYRTLVAWIEQGAPFSVGAIVARCSAGQA